MADNKTETSEVNQDSSEGVPAVVVEEGSTHEEVERPTPKSTEVEVSDADGNTRETAEEDSADAENLAKEEETSTQDSESQQNGKHEENTEADSTEVDGTEVGEKRKSADAEENVAKKVRAEEAEEVPADVPAATNGEQEASA